MIYRSIFLIIAIAVFSCTCVASPWLPTSKEIRKLYPYLSDRDYTIKLDGATTPFLFLRTFVPLYYLLVKNNPPVSLKSAGALPHAGWCIGDAHPENFGILLLSSGKPMFTVNDVDDAGPCPLAIDALRFFVAVRLYDKDINLKKLHRVYLNSLNGGQITFSDTVLKMAQWAAGRIDPAGKVLDGKHHIKRNDLMADVDTSELEAIQTLVTLKFGVNARLLDATKMRKASGGSGGLLRYRALVKILGQDEAHGKSTILYELKDTQPPGVFPLAAGPLGTPAQRLAKTVQMEQGTVASQMSIEHIFDQQMLLRTRPAGNLGVVLDDLKKSAIEDILQDEAAILGRIHIRATSKLAAFREAMNKIGDDDWENEADILAKMMKKLFASLN